jgi:hypothetical protein
LVGGVGGAIYMIINSHALHIIFNWSLRAGGSQPIRGRNARM